MGDDNPRACACDGTSKCIVHLLRDERVRGLNDALVIARLKKEANPGAVGVGAFVVMQALEAHIAELEKGK